MKRMGWSPDRVSLWGLVRPCILYVCSFHHFDLRHCMCVSCKTSPLYLILTWGFVCVCHVKPAHFTSFWLEALYVCNVKPAHFTSFWLEPLYVCNVKPAHFTSFWHEVLYVMNVKSAHFTSFWFEVLYACHECEISTLYIILIWSFVCVWWMWNQHTLHHFDLKFCMCVMNVKSAHFTSFWFEALCVCDVKPAHTLSSDLTEKQ